MEYKIRTKT